MALGKDETERAHEDGGEATPCYIPHDMRRLERLWQGVVLIVVGLVLEGAGSYMLAVLRATNPLLESQIRDGLVCFTSLFVLTIGILAIWTGRRQHSELVTPENVRPRLLYSPHEESRSHIPLSCTRRCQADANRGSVLI
jgi:hypothetical protein